MFIGKLFIIISALFSFALACHSKGKATRKIIENECNFINVSDSHELLHQKQGYTENPISRKKYVFSSLRNQILQHFRATKIKSNFLNFQLI